MAGVGVGDGVGVPPASLSDGLGLGVGDGWSGLASASATGSGSRSATGSGSASATGSGSGRRRARARGRRRARARGRRRASGLGDGVGVDSDSPQFNEFVFEFDTTVLFARVAITPRMPPVEAWKAVVTGRLTSQRPAPGEAATWTTTSSTRQRRCTQPRCRRSYHLPRRCSATGKRRWLRRRRACRSRCSRSPCQTSWDCRPPRRRSSRHSGT